MDKDTGATHVVLLAGICYDLIYESLIQTEDLANDVPIDTLGIEVVLDNLKPREVLLWS